MLFIVRMPSCARRGGTHAYAHGCSAGAGIRTAIRTADARGPTTDTQVRMPPSKRPASGTTAQRDSATIRLGARPWVHAAYCCVILAIISAQYFLDPAPSPGSTETIVTGPAI